MILVRNLDHFPSFCLKCDLLCFDPIFFDPFCSDNNSNDNNNDDNNKFQDLTHSPEWNSPEVVRAMLSVLQEALKDSNCQRYE